MAEDLMTTDQAAHHFDVTAKTVRLWCRQGLFPGAFKAGPGHRAPWIIPTPALEGFVPPSIRRKRKEDI